MPADVQLDGLYKYWEYNRKKERLGRIFQDRPTILVCIVLLEICNKVRYYISYHSSELNNCMVEVIMTNKTDVAITIPRTITTFNFNKKFV